MYDQNRAKSRGPSEQGQSGDDTAHTHCPQVS